jgi:transposase
MSKKGKAAAPEPMVCAMRVRVYPTKSQQSKLANALHAVHVFRNEVVSFTAERRKIRGAWIRQHPTLSKEWKPEEFAGRDSDAASKWLTQRLEAARILARQEGGFLCGQKALVGACSTANLSLTRQERAELLDSCLLTMPRTVFDQVLQDLGKTNSKAIKDRMSKLKKPASFPVHHKWSYATSLRLQIDENKNPTYQDHWAAGKLFIPCIGYLPFRDKLKLPKTPAKLITIARDADGHFYASFVCAPGEGKNAKRKVAALPLSGDLYKGKPMPKITGIDLGLSSRSTDNEGKKSGRTRYLKRCANELRFRNQSLSRKKHGSKGWQKERQKLGEVHTNIANQREVGIQLEAQEIAKNNAIVCAEDLWLAFMLKNPTLAGSAHDAALGRFTTVLERECNKRGHLFIRCGRFDASTKTCFECKAINHKINLSDRTWTCPECGAYLDRDTNAAKNILVMALEKAIRDFSVLPEPGDKASLSPEQQLRSLHPDLRKFISRGGLTALLDRHRSGESRQGQILPLEVSGPMNRELRQ